MRSIRKIIPILCFIICRSAYSQEVLYYLPVQFSLYSHSYEILNPSAIGMYDNFFASAGSQQYLSGFSNISTSFFILNKTVFQKNNHQFTKNNVGICFHNEQEGRYINRSRFYLMYAWHARINSHLNISGGIDFGMMNISIQGTPSTGSISIYSFDANTGMSLYSNRFCFGITANQLLGSTLQPFSQKIKLLRHATAYGKYQLRPAKNIFITPSAIIRYPNDRHTPSGNIDLEFLLFNRYNISSGYAFKNGLVIHAGIQAIKFLKGSVSVDIGYTSPLHNDYIKINTGEVVVSYRK